MNEKVDIEVFKRKLTVELEGFTPMEIATLARQVTEKMEQVFHRNKNTGDSGKLAILAALEIAAELYREQNARSTEKRATEHKIEELSLSLQTTLSTIPGKE